MSPTKDSSDATSATAGYPPVPSQALVLAGRASAGVLAGKADDNSADPCALVSLPASHMRCRIVRQITAEMVMLVGERVQMRRDRRRSSCHVRQISMYLCHVVLQISLTDIGRSFGRDRTTVGHACHVVEDRRDDRSYDDFVGSIERVVLSVFGAAGGWMHD